MSDIVETLRKGEAESVDGWWFVMAEAANEIERLRAENERLREALMPFASFYALSSPCTDEAVICEAEEEGEANLTHGDLRAAASALGYLDEWRAIEMDE